MEFQYIVKQQRKSVHSYDPSIDPRRTRRQQYTEERYYGFRGIPRQPNYAIVAACLLFIFVGSAAQFLAILWVSDNNWSCSACTSQQCQQKHIIDVRHFIFLLGTAAVLWTEDLWRRSRTRGQSFMAKQGRWLKKTEMTNNWISLLEN